MLFKSEILRFSGTYPTIFLKLLLLVCNAFSELSNFAFAEANEDSD